MPVRETEVLVVTKDREAQLSRQKTLSKTYTLFGGTNVPHNNAVQRFFVSGLNVKDASPDFSHLRVSTVVRPVLRLRTVSIGRIPRHHRRWSPRNPVKNIA